MKNTIKRAIQILFIIGIILLFSNKVFAASFSPSSGWKHADIWNNGKTEFFSHLELNHNYSRPTITNGFTVKDNLSLILCKQKGGAIRFTPEYENNFKWDWKKIDGWTSNWCPTCSPTAAKEKSTGIATGVANKIKGMLTTETGSWKGKKIGENDYTDSTYYRYNGYGRENTVYIENISVEAPVSGERKIIGYSERYATTPTYNKVGETEEEKNNEKAYIMSSGLEFSPTKNGFKEGNYNTTTVSDRADDQLIQNALWKKSKNDVGSGFNKGNNYTNNDEGLCEEAKEYRKCYINGLRNYASNVKKLEVKIKNQNNEEEIEKPQVIVNRDDKNNGNNTTYLVGPFSIQYPNDHRFSYIEDIHIETYDKTNGNNKKAELLYSNGDFEIIKKDGTKGYPDSEDIFYVKFNAQKAGNPTSIKIKVDFAYLASCYSKYEVYEGTGELRKIKITAEVQKDDDWCKGPATNPHSKWSGAYKLKKDSNGNVIYINGIAQTEPDLSSTIETPVQKEIWKWKSEIVKVGTYKAQILAKLLERQRTWKRHELDLTDTEIDLTIDLGGYVWEDGKKDKETENDNKMAIGNNSPDKAMEGVKVTLYEKFNGDKKIKATLADNGKKNGQQTINPTYTDKNGNYKFTGINASKQYYVEFTYNSQYYQPVEYVSPTDGNSGWGTENWKGNSNGTDVIVERENKNARFASIGSSPENYTVTENGKTRTNKTYSKNVLLGKKLNEKGEFIPYQDYGIINEFGNLKYNKDGEILVREKGEKESYIEVSKLSSNEKAIVESKIQYVLDCQLNSYTGKSETKNRNNDYYPIYTTFVEDEKLNTTTSNMQKKGYFGIGEIKEYYKNGAPYHINQGYEEREKVELALYKDVARVHTEINDHKQDYRYESRSKDSKRNEKGDLTENIIDIRLRLADAYYKTEYYREIQPADYEYKVTKYGDKAGEYGKTTEDELKVYVKYKFTVYNNSELIRTRIDEIVDYYDNDLEFFEEKNGKYQMIDDKYMKDNTYAMLKGEKINLDDGRFKITTNSTKYSGNTELPTNGEYQKLYFNVNTEEYLTQGEGITYYITFRVKKKDNYIILDEDTKGKENFAEINGYSTKYYENVKIPNRTDVDFRFDAGIIDIYSNPGNITLDDMKNSKYENFESDTDKAPDIFLRLRNDEESRIIRGTVWEDSRTKNSTSNSRVGDGILDDGEAKIDGVTVQLVEVMNNGNEFVWQTVSSGEGTYNKNNITEGISEKGFTPIINYNNIVTAVGKKTDANEKGFENGEYIFKSFPAGNYVIRFIYGDTVKTVLPNSNNENRVTSVIKQNGLNSKSYSGQDYKSTSYQINSTEGNKYTAVNSRDYDYNIDNIEKLEEETGRMSDAKDLKIRRTEVNNYSNNNGNGVRNERAEILSSNELLQSYDKENTQNIIDKLEKLMNNTAMIAETGKIDVGIERPKDYITNLEDGKGTTESNRNYDQNDKSKIGDNLDYGLLNIDFGLEERPKAQLVVDKEVTNVKLTLADGTTLFDANQKATNVLWQKHKNYNVITEKNLISKIENLRTENANSIGLIQMSMDEELMHGATIKITYKITVRNEGEVDFADDKFYYTGEPSNESTIVTTRANTLVDYVANNLKFMADDNTNWETIKLINETNQVSDLVNSNLKEEIKMYNTIIVTKDEKSNINGKELVPRLYNEKGSKVDDQLILTQSLATENSSDDLNYKNIVEIVSTNNTVGRRMAFSVVGNQDPTKEPQEIDSDKAEVVKILPPFGESSTYILITATIIASIGLLIGGIIFIKKKVLVS